MSSLSVYNSLIGKKEIFTPITKDYVGMYVCGPTVYSNVHLGNCRTFMSFDLIFRYLKHLGYKVRYVRNITDAGHLENDADEGEDRIAKKARIEKVEPMEVVQRYTVDFHQTLEKFNNLPPSIEPTATGHIIEQIEIIKGIIEAGFAYEINGSVYFDVIKFNEVEEYGKLSGRKIEDLIHNTRTLDGQSDKKNPQDFALWKKAEPQHIMRWPSPWSDGFPGWHLECTAMSTKYLGEQFDIHGGGMDLKFPHHECEVAQNVGCCEKEPANFWMHANMLTVNGEKMSKSKNNGFLPEELFTGDNPVLEKGYSPMTVRFFMLQTHYRSTLDFSNQAIQASEKGFQRLCDAINTLESIEAGSENTVDIESVWNKAVAAMDDDFNTPVLIANLFDAVKLINSIADKKESIDSANLTLLKKLMHDFTFDVLGLKLEQEESAEAGLEDDLMQLLIQMRIDAKKDKNYAQADQIRDALSALDIELKDTSDGAVWTKK